MLNTVSRIRGQVRTNGYPQTEGQLGDCMLRYGHELGEDSVFGTKFYHPQNNNWVYITSNAPQLVYPKLVVVKCNFGTKNPSKIQWYGHNRILSFMNWKIGSVFLFSRKAYSLNHVFLGLFCRRRTLGHGRGLVADGRCEGCLRHQCQTKLHWPPAESTGQRPQRNHSMLQQTAC